MCVYECGKYNRAGYLLYLCLALFSKGWLQPQTIFSEIHTQLCGIYSVILAATPWQEKRVNLEVIKGKTEIDCCYSFVEFFLFKGFLNSKLKNDR